MLDVRTRKVARILTKRYFRNYAIMLVTLLGLSLVTNIFKTNGTFYETYAFLPIGGMTVIMTSSILSKMGFLAGHIGKERSQQLLLPGFSPVYWATYYILLRRFLSKLFPTGLLICTSLKQILAIQFSLNCSGMLQVWVETILVGPSPEWLFMG